MTTLPTRRQGRVAKIESFGPELIEIWKKAPLVLTFADDSTATHLRFRLYSLRTAMGNSELPEHRPLYMKAIKMKISKTRRYDSSAKRTVWDLKIYDADVEYKTILAQIGVEVPEPPDLDDK